MNKGILLSFALLTAMLFPPSLNASEDHGMMELCKTECPSAKTEHETHKCMDELAKKRKNDKKFRKTDCYSAYREHEKHENESGHNH
jgi:hypothetical protein